ncbi:MAG TPA: TfoX/Sxy family protein [Conexibacter sp.]|nr:TfoX/Sxy family protein [Conexibacter sp.]
MRPVDEAGRSRSRCARRPPCGENTSRRGTDSSALVVTLAQMFGGIAFLHHGNMVCGVVGETLMLRLGAELADAALAAWVTRALGFAETLPPKR